LSSHRVLIVVMTILAVWASYFGAVQKMEWPLYKIFAQLAPTQATDAKVAVIAIDDKSIKSNEQKPWGSGELAKLASTLRSFRGKSLVWLPPVDAHDLSADIDTVMQKLNPKEKKQFQRLISGLDKNGTLLRLLDRKNVIYMVPYAAGNAQPGTVKAPSLEVDTVIKDSVLGRALTFIYAMPQTEYSVNNAQTDLFKSARNGFYPAPEHGATIVQEPLIIKLQDKYFPSAALQVLALINGATQKKIQFIPSEGVRVQGQMFATDPAFNVVPRLGEAKFDKSIVPVYSAIDVVTGKIKAVELNEFDVLVVGQSHADTAMVKLYSGDKSSYPVWFANLVNTLVQGNVVNVPYGSHVIQRCLILVVALYFIFLPLRLRGYVGLAFSGFLAVLMINAMFFSMFLYTSWLKITIPVLFLVVGHLIVAFHFKLTMAFKSLQLEAANAYRELALNEQTHGNLDKAFAYMRKCPMDKKLLECLYNLGIEFESRRQFRQAVAVYEYISRKDSNYRDIQERKARHQTVSSPNLLSRTSTPNTAATLVVDHPNVARPVLGRYQVEKIVGQGAMGTVYLGVDPKIGRTVAIKTLALSEEFDQKQLEDVRRRFFREAETAGRLNHPNIVTIYDVGEEHDLAYIAMDFITGDGLDNFVQGETLLSIDEVFQIGVEVAEALDYAHAQNVVHRDVKPANIIYDPKTHAIKVTDFGIACLTDTSKTRTGTIMGSPSYMSPEQLEGTDVDGRSDLYSLGVTLYQLFTATLPFTADSMSSLAYKIVKDKPKGIRQVRAELPVCLSRVINKTLEKNPDDRYQNGAELAKALRRCGGL